LQVSEEFSILDFILKRRSIHFSEDFPMKLALFVVIFVASLVPTRAALAQDENALTRDEVAQIKKKLVAALEALGQPPAGYSKESETFNLPTEAYRREKNGSRYNPIGAGANRTYGTEMKAKSESEEMSKEYKKKIMEAQAKGDYVTMSKLSQEMSQKVGKQQLEASEKAKEPISLTISFNSNPYATIDPDAVLFERPGAIALKMADNSSTGKERVSVYFDPVALKSTKELSRVELREPKNGVANKTAVLNVTIQLYGPVSDVEAWAKKIDVAKVLAQIDRGT